MKNKSRKQSFLNRAQSSFLKTYWVHLLFIFFAANFLIMRTLQLQFYAQSCMTTAQLQSDARCLYSLNGLVYQKGTRTSPHHGHPCGMDVTTIIPRSHIGNAAKYLDPNLVGNLCSSTNVIPTPTPTPRPVSVPTATPTPRPTIAVTPTPTPRPAAVVIPTATPTPHPSSGVTPGVSTPTPAPRPPTPTPTTESQIVYVAPTPTPTPVPVVDNSSSTPTATPTPTPMAQATPTPTGSGSGFGQYITGSGGTTPAPNPQGVAAGGASNEPGGPYSTIVLWSEILVGISFVMLVVTLVIGFVKKLFLKKK